MKSNPDALSSPIQNLPPELLSEIFQWFFHSVAVAFHRLVFLKIGSSWSHYPTLELSWVCSRWRKLVTAQPTFWSSILVHAEDGFGFGLREMFLHYISLSRNAPLTFILLGKGWTAYKRSDLHFVVDTMLDNLHRWCNFFCLTWETESLGWLDSFLKDKKPSPAQSTNDQGQTQIRTRSGEVIELQVPNLKHLRMKRLPVQLLTSYPKLQILEIDSLHLSDFSLCDFPNLRTLHVDFFYGTGLVFDVIRQTPLLDELHIGTNGWCLPKTGYHTVKSNRVLVSNPPYSSNLTTISISIDCLWPGAWKNIIFPRVRSLVVTTKFYDFRKPEIPSAIMVELAEMLSFSFSYAHPQDTPLGLQRVAFGGIPAPIIVNFLQSHPSVSQLTFPSSFGRRVHDEIFTLMSAKPFVAPHLQTLSLADSSCEHYTYTDANDLDTYSHIPEVQMALELPIPPELCCLAQDVSSMIETRNGAIESPSCRLQHLVLGYRLSKCMDLTSLQDRLASLGVTVVRVKDRELESS